MARTRVFVDDLVLGDLPMVCAKTGLPADGKAPVTVQVGGGVPGWAFLLVFLGPVGWLALLFVALTGGGGEQVQGWVPMTEAAHDRARALRRNVHVAFGVVAVGAATAVLVAATGSASPLPAVGVAVAGVVAAGMAGMAADRAGVATSLDGSRRWVTLDRVHPGFVAAVDGTRRRDRDASR